MSTAPLSPRNLGDMLPLRVVAERLGVSLSTVKRYVEHGELLTTDVSAGNGMRARRRVSEFHLQQFAARRSG